jgi:hypothetical protein
MAHSLQQERQLLSTQEVALVEKTHQPILGTLSDKDLAQLCKLVRDRRDRAQQIAACQRREMRGKSDPKGSRAASGNTGTRGKGDVLAAAVERLNEEVTRRVAKTSRQQSIDNATRVLEMRRASETKAVQPHPASADKAGKGKKLKAQVPSRAPHNPAKVGAISQHTKNMQAKRDSR